MRTSKQDEARQDTAGQDQSMPNQEQPSAEVLLPGNVGGAVLVDGTVRRPVGPWTPAVHALLRHLDGRVPGVPRVLGHDERGREILSFLPGRVIDIDAEELNPAQIAALARWTRRFHEAVTGFAHPGPWRFFEVPGATLVGHNDIAPYNACFDADLVAGVFDWDFAGPSTPLLELAFMAWNCVPLWRDIGADRAAERLEVLASAYGGPGAADVLRAVPWRIQAMLDWIPARAAAGDAGMVNLMSAGEPGRSQASLDGLIRRIPAIGRLVRS